jgi:large subunit ribosomal protein L31
MPQAINSTYHKDSTVKCSNCGSVYTFGSTMKEFTIEVCGNCHPFYTGQDTVLDTTGRIEKFQQKMEKSQALKVELLKSKNQEEFVKL